VTQRPNDDSDARHALAALTACLVLTLDKRDPGFAADYCVHLAKMHKSMTDYDDRPGDGVFETLTWTDDLIRTPRA
jgi:hypothetical protein